LSIEKVTIERFLALSAQCPVLDVRSPGEYAHAHIPGAYSLPLFTDEERKIVGTAYKQQGRKDAIKLGLDFFGTRMRAMVETVEGWLEQARPAGSPAPFTNQVIVHCWRGGMRSAGVAWLLDLYGFKVYALSGGYKSYRRWAGTQFEKSHPLFVVGGYTGTGKTKILRELQLSGKPVIDLEQLASHKGSAFGGIGEKPQPSQEMFENLLAKELWRVNQQEAGGQPTIFIEDESQRIGSLNIPGEFWKTMKNSPLLFIDIPFEERLSHLLDEYGGLPRQELVDAIERIRRRLGGQAASTAINFLLENNHRECFRVLLSYYDKSYNKAMLARQMAGPAANKTYCESVDIKTITNTLINESATA
jgi:tRNA 2-selenouridine synthase